MKAISGLVFVVLLIVATPPSFAIDVKISDTRENNFYLDALRWVLEKSGAKYNLISTKHPLSSQTRKVLLLKNKDIDVIYAGTSRRLEEDLLPVRFPIMRGLSGQRIFLINKNYQTAYDSVKNIKDLKKHMGFQGIGWEDKKILEASGLGQVTRLYDEIFISVDAGSSFYFSRGVTEIFSELIDKKRKMPNLAIEDNILLTYKSAVFFFVHPENAELAEILETGFVNGYKDGSYERFFYSHPLIKSSIEQARLGERTIIQIPNPHLSSATDAIPNEYWHQD